MERIKKYEPLLGSWRIKRKIGEGNYGAVYEVEKSLYGDITSKSAVKLISFRNSELLYGIHMEETLSEDEIERIKRKEAEKNVREVLFMNTLQGKDNIVTIYDYDIIPGENATDILIRMELLTSLSHYDGKDRADKEFVIKLGIDICKALESCEKEKIIHRDIKPDNIFVNKEGDFKLGDFGLSRKMSQSVSVSLRKIKGTPLYMSPEAFDWGQQVDHTSDLYSLGIVMYQMLNDGKIPFGTIKEDYDDEGRAIRKRLDGKEILPPVHGDGRLWEIIQKAIRFKKEERYQSAEAMRRDLEELVQEPKRTAEQDNVENNYYGEGKKTERNLKEAVQVQRYREAAEQGDAAAQNRLGDCYYRGKGVKKDWKEAAHWYDRAAENGNVEAQRNLGALYYNGEGLEKDLKKALYWYKKAGSIYTVKTIEKELEEQNEKQEVKIPSIKNKTIPKKKAKSIKAKTALNKIIKYSSIGLIIAAFVWAQWNILQSPEESYFKKVQSTWELKVFQLCEIGAKRGNALTQYILGNGYYNGKGVEKDQKKAAYWYEKAAEQGYAAAQNNLGFLYYNGEGVEKNLEKAVHWYEKAAEQGYAAAQNNLANCFYRGEGLEKNLEEAVYWYEKAAEQGNVAAQNNLGNCYYQGEGVGKDWEKAVKWYEKAAKQEYASAQNNLGNCYYSGKGVEQNYKKAVKWYKKAAEQGYVYAQNNLGDCYYNGEGVEKDLGKASQWYVKAMEGYEKAAEQGDTTAQTNLGNIYYNGERVDKDFEKAVKWYKRAAKQGDAIAQNNLGDCYYRGEGVEKDYEKAVKWYEKSAAQGNAAAQNNLGYCYNNGEGVEKDYEKAVEWYEKSAEQGYDVAQTYLGLCYELGEGVEQDYKKAVEWYEKAAEQGYAAAQYRLGWSYESGEGVEKDIEKAVEWFEKAAETGYANARNHLGNLYEKGKGIEKDLEKALYWYEKAGDEDSVKKIKKKLNY